MKLAISGKGGVGKSTLSAGLALRMAADGMRVLAVDADPDANLAAALGISPEERKKIIPVSQRKELIEERTGARIGRFGQAFKLNPTVDDLAEVCGYQLGNITLIVLGSVEVGASGCACPESVLLRALVQNLVLHKNETLIMDMEAGVEHLGRATARGVDSMITVVEPGSRAVECALRVRRMANEIGIKNVHAVGNKIASVEDAEFLRSALGDLPLIGEIPWSELIRLADREGRVSTNDSAVDEAFVEILEKLS